MPPIFSIPSTLFSPFGVLASSHPAMEARLPFQQAPEPTEVRQLCFSRICERICQRFAKMMSVNKLICFLSWNLGWETWEMF